MMFLDKKPRNELSDEAEVDILDGGAHVGAHLEEDVAPARVWGVGFRA